MVINIVIIVILNKCLFHGCTLPLCWTVYVSFLGEFIYKVSLKCNAEIVVSFDVLIYTMVDLSYFRPTFPREKKVNPENLLFYLLPTTFSMIWIPACLIKLSYNNFDHMTISKISVT